MRTSFVFFLALGLAGCSTTKSASPAISDAPDAQVVAEDTGGGSQDMDCAAGEIAQEGECVPCGAGTHSFGGDASQCTPCEPGTTDQDADPATECDACTEPEGDVYTINVCMPAQDTQFTDCSTPEAGERVLERCAKGSSSERGSDTEFAECSEPGPDQYVSTACDPGAPNDRGSDTSLEDCTEAGDGESISVPCDPGAFDAEGSDAVIAACSEPGEGEYVVSACVDGIDTVVAACSTAEDSEYTVADCVTGDSSTPGSDTAVEACSAPGEGEFVATPCADDTDAIIATCTTAGEDEFVATPCAGDADAIIAACATPGPGEYVTAICSGDSDTVLDACTEPDATMGTYALASCEPGTPSTTGFDTAIEPCTLAGAEDLPAASECITGSSAESGADRVPGGAVAICLDTATNPDSVGAEADWFFAVDAEGAWSVSLAFFEDSVYCGTVERLEAGILEYYFAADTSSSAISDFAYTSDTVFAAEVLENELTDACNGWDTSGCEAPVPEEVDYCHIQWPETVFAFPGDDFEAYLWVYEPGTTGTDGTGSGVVVDLGIGPVGDAPSDDWAWSSCSFKEHKPGLDPAVLDNDEYECISAAPEYEIGMGFGPWSYQFAGRVSIDGGPWLYCDLGADFGAGSSDGYSTDNAGRLTTDIP